MHVFRFRDFGFKTPIQALKIVFWGGFDPLNGEAYQRHPKGHILVQKYVTWRTDRQNRSTGATCARDEETKKRQRQKPDSGKQWPRPPTSSHRNEIVHGGWSSDVGFKFRISSKSIYKRFRSCGGRNLPIPIYLAVGIYNSLYYRTSGEQKHVTSHVFAETTHVVAEPCGFACVMRDRGRNRHGPKRGDWCAPFAWRELGPRLTQCGLGRGLLPYQVASSSIQPFGHHNRYGPKTGGCGPLSGER